MFFIFGARHFIPVEYLTIGHSSCSLLVMENKRKIWGSMHPFYEGGAILGRTVANRYFLDALIAKDYFDEYHFFLPLPAHCTELEETLAEKFPIQHKAGRFTVKSQREVFYYVQKNEYYAFHLSDPFVKYTDIMRIRNAYSQNIFPVTAPTHSLSYADYGQDFLYHIWAGVSPRDVVVATSHAGEAVVNNMYNALKRNYALPQDFVAPAVQRIPLGVDPASMPEAKDKSTLGALCRAKYGIAENSTIFLCFARISYQSKMDLLPVLRAFKRAEGMGLASSSYHFVVAGWADDDDPFADDLKGFAAALGIPCSIIKRPSDIERKAIYAAADVFVSLSDNLQETFGLTMLEAAAAGLPVIASDFDGYKDLVVPDVTGVLVPSVGPSVCLATNELSSIVPASEYHLYLAQQCSVDVRATGEAMYRLATDKPLRERMGQQARERAVNEYSWSRIIDKYIELWQELNAVPLSDACMQRLRSATHPAAEDFMEVFGSYYSAQVRDEAFKQRIVRWSRVGEAIYREQDFPVIYKVIEERVDLALLKQLLFKARKPVTIAALLELLPDNGRFADQDFLLLWALKHDFLEFVAN